MCDSGVPEEKKVLVALVRPERLLGPWLMLPVDDGGILLGETLVNEQMWGMDKCHLDVKFEYVPESALETAGEGEFEGW
jgi:hypothetical protein